MTNDSSRRGAARAGRIADTAACLALCLLIAPGAAGAQEQCAYGWTAAKNADGASLYQLEDCEGSITAFSCSRSQRRLIIVLPGFARTVGAQEPIVFAIGGKPVTMMARVVLPDAGLKAAMVKEQTFSADARGYEIALTPGDPLWRALTTPRPDIAYRGEGWTSSFFIDKAGARRLRAMAAQCGL